MPADLTIFTANYMIFIEAVVALGVVSYALYRGSRDEMLRWLLSAGVTGVVAEILTQIGGVLYRDPRPFAEGHYRPLIAHVADNGFPSDHGLLAAFLVVCVLLTRVWLAVPITATLAILVDWARVGAGIHHPHRRDWQCRLRGYRSQYRGGDHSVLVSSTLASPSPRSHGPRSCIVLATAFTSCQARERVTPVMIVQLEPVMA